MIEKAMTRSSHAVNTNVKPTLYDRLHLRMISIMHDSLYTLFVNPDDLLKAAGLNQNQTVLEVGCGPGFFTVAAAKIVGKGGRLYSLDINPAAVERVELKLIKAGVTNAEVKLANASNTGLLENSINVAFFFGIAHSLRDLDPILREMHRILKKNGILSVQRSSSSEKNLMNRFTKLGLFRFVSKERRIYRFEKIPLLNIDANQREEVKKQQ